MQETWVPSLGGEDSLEEEMATHSRTLAWRLPWTEEPGGLQSVGLLESDTTGRLNHHPQARSVAMLAPSDLQPHFCPALA